MIGIALILASTFAYNGSAVLLAVETRRHSGGSALLLAVSRRASGVLAISMNVLGWGLEVAALTMIPLTLARVLNAAGLVVLLGLTHRILKEPLGLRALLGVCSVALGTVAAGFAPPRLGGLSPTVAQYALLCAILLPGISLPYALRAVRRQPGAAVMATAAGLAYALSGILNKSVAVEIHASRIPALALLVVCISILGIWGFVIELEALKNGRVSAVVPIVLALHTIVPIACAPLLFGEVWPVDPLSRLLLGGGISLTLLGVIALTGSTDRSPVSR